MLSFLLSACALEGDFGRPRASIFDRIADELLPSETTLLGSRGGSGVTNDEMAMREAGHRLSSPLTPPQSPAAGPSGGYGGARSYYYKVPNPLAKIEENLQIDHQVLTHFGQAARRVLITDSRRMQAVYDHDPNILIEDKRSARERMKENYVFIEQTFEDLGRRFLAYNYELDELKNSKPDLVTVEMDGSLNHLRDRAASLKYELTRYFGTAVARKGDYRPPRFASREMSKTNYVPRPQPYPAPPSYDYAPRGMTPHTSK
ncbi:MAG: hypothetical protein ACTSP0_05520 [Alphaproteobacteria bacterium]